MGTRHLPGLLMFLGMRILLPRLLGLGGALWFRPGLRRGAFLWRRALLRCGSLFLRRGPYLRCRALLRHWPWFRCRTWLRRRPLLRSRLYLLYRPCRRSGPLLGGWMELRSRPLLRYRAHLLHRPFWLSWPKLLGRRLHSRTRLLNLLCLPCLRHRPYRLTRLQGMVDRLRQRALYSRQCYRLPPFYGKRFRNYDRLRLAAVYGGELGAVGTRLQSCVVAEPLNSRQTRLPQRGQFRRARREDSRPHDHRYSSRDCRW